MTIDAVMDLSTRICLPGKVKDVTAADSLDTHSHTAAGCLRTDDPSKGTYHPVPAPHRLAYGIESTMGLDKKNGLGRRQPTPVQAGARFTVTTTNGGYGRVSGGYWRVVKQPRNWAHTSRNKAAPDGASRANRRPDRFTWPEGTHHMTTTVQKDPSARSRITEIIEAGVA